MTYPPNQRPPIWSIDPGIVAYNCKKHGMPYPAFAMPMWGGAGNIVHNYGFPNPAIEGRNLTLYNDPQWRAGGIELTGSSSHYGKIYAKHDVNDLEQRSTVFINAKLVGDNTTKGLLSRGNTEFDSMPGMFMQVQSDTTLRVYYGSYIGATDVGNNKFTACLTSGVYTNGWRRFYINGDQKGSVQNSFWVDGNDYLWLGCGYNGYVNAIIYDLIFFRAELNAAQVKFLSENPYFMYQIPEELYGYVAAVGGVSPTGVFYGQLYGPFMGAIG